MDKLLVEVFVPILDTRYEIIVPANVPVSSVQESVIKAVGELAEGRFLPSPGTSLCLRESGRVLDINQSVWEQGIRNGARLMLI